MERLRAVASTYDGSVAQVALAWLLARPSVTDQPLLQALDVDH